MPNTQEQPPAGPVRYRAIRIGTGRGRRILHIAIVRKAGRAPARTTAQQQ